jgi:FMN-dependent NADH-azoreductase
MTRLFYADASPRGDRSISRVLTKEFVTEWQSKYLDSTVTYRDLGREPVPLVSENWIAAAFSNPADHTPKQADAIRISNELVDEFLAADYYVFGVPMYNFSITAGFKAYIDQITRAGRTFSLDETGYHGLVHNKKMLIIMTQGGSYPVGSPAQRYDMQTPYLQLIFGFLGITDIEFVYADNLMSGDEARSQSITNAQTGLRTVLSKWAAS